MCNLGAVVNFVFDDVPEPAAYRPLHGNVGNINEACHRYAIEFVETLERSLLLHHQPEFETLAGDVVVLDFRYMHELLAKGACALVGTPLQFVFGNQLESLQSNSAESLVVFPENADFIDRCSNWSARHKRSLAQAEAWRNWLKGCEAGRRSRKDPG